MGFRFHLSAAERQPRASLIRLKATGVPNGCRPRGENAWMLRVCAVIHCGQLGYDVSEPRRTASGTGDGQLVILSFSMKRLAGLKVGLGEALLSR